MSTLIIIFVFYLYFQNCIPPPPFAHRITYQSCYCNVVLFYLRLFPGHAGSDVLLVTHDDELLVFGFNSLNCLGKKFIEKDLEKYTYHYNTQSLEKIEALSKKRIKGNERLRSIVFLYVLCVTFFCLQY